MLQRLVFILLCSRVFSSPMTILSWLVIFVYSLLDAGNFWYGILCLIGLCLAHFGTNILDDYFDYKALIKQVGFDKEKYLKNSQKTKCRYLISGKLKEFDLLALAGIYFFLAFLVGLFLYIKCGQGVLYFALIGGIIGVIYPFASRICLSEVLVALAYGPALFGGVYYVMCGTYTTEVFILSIPTMIMTVVLLYIHTVMDYEYDNNEGKKTIANSFDSQLEALLLLKIFLIIAYASVPVLCICDIVDWQVFGVFFTIPLAIDLYKSMVDFSCDESSVPVHKWYHFPMENMERLRKNGEDAFMIRIYQARNLMVYFSVFLVIGIFFSLGL
ncbi:MAG: prenyltransferase [bacterium]|nr:prenyltransferase [bacterium]